MIPSECSEIYFGSIWRHATPHHLCQTPQSLTIFNFSTFHLSDSTLTLFPGLDSPMRLSANPPCATRGCLHWLLCKQMTRCLKSKTRTKHENKKHGNRTSMGMHLTMVPTTSVSNSTAKNMMWKKRIYQEHASSLDINNFQYNHFSRTVQHIQRLSNFFERVFQS